MKISFSRSAITRHEAWDRSLEHELIEKRGGVAVHDSKGEEKKKKKKKRRGWWISSSPCNPAIYSPFLARVYEAIRAYLDG